jgi:DNA-binding XRE family transcriptional regulator
LRTDDTLLEIQEVRVGDETFCLVPMSDYLRLVKEAGGTLVDAVDYARASIGRDLLRRRERAGLTQSEVAAKAGIRPETLSRLENGRANPTFATVRRILTAFGVRNK